ncbi:Cys-Gln thioester bond-forming surface protein [Streptomyces luteireticuli]|uniref:Cys-Gln thioester bond-forming surface protein n=1 Tax=Streptomyces luteireticuli TaxID=173858 RepID=UPI0035587929
MSSVLRRGSACLATVALAVALAVAGAVGPAGAAVVEEGPQDAGGVAATLGGEMTAKAWAHVKGGSRPGNVMAGLFEMKVDGGGTLQTYCVDVNTGTVNGAAYKEVGWSESSLQNNPRAGKIRWILQNSYPRVDDLAALARKSGAGTLDADLAAAGTQVAIWRYSDGAKVEANDPAAEKLADYLYDNAEDLKEPAASLSLGPLAVSGRPGTRIGPVTVRTNADGVTVTPSGDAGPRNVKIVDKAGRPVTTTTDGGRLYFDVPAGTPDGGASFTAAVNTEVPVGRAFIGDRIRTQTMILAGSSRSAATAVATVQWARKGAVPAVSARKKCAEGGLEVAAGNRGDKPYAVVIDGRKHRVGPGRSRTVLVKAAEDRPYRITVTGPGGFSRTFSGVLDCRTGAPEVTTATAVGDTTGGAGPSPSGSGPGTGSPGSAPAGGSGSPGRSGLPEPDADSDLAVTGSRGASPATVGVAAALVVVGGTAVFLLRRKRTAATDE